MITNIESIANVGKFENYTGNQELGENQIVFGFNGTGKSTLSDILYSLAHNSSIPNYRKTLDKADGTTAGEMRIVLKSTRGDLVYENGTWNNDYPMAVFNNQYINKYVLINDDNKKDMIGVNLGSQSVKLVKEKNKFEAEAKNHLQVINDFIKNNTLNLTNVFLLYIKRY